MDLAHYLTAVRRDGDLLAATPADVLDTVVPSCPAWTVGQLVGHTGWVYRWVTATLRADPASPPNPKSIEAAPQGTAVLEWYRVALGELLTALGEVDLDRTFKTFAGPQNGHWWARRMAHETSVHRWDRQQALGAATPIETELALDGIDEVLDTYLPRRFDHATFRSQGQTLHLHATDGAGEWMLTMKPDAVHCQRTHGKGDVALRGSASDLLLFVTSRLDPEQLDTFGQLELAQRWQAAANF